MSLSSERVEPVAVGCALEASIGLVAPMELPAFEATLELVQDTDAVNQRLIASGRGDLVITQQAQMAPYSPQRSENFSRRSLTALMLLINETPGDENRSIGAFVDLRTANQPAATAVTIAKEAGFDHRTSALIIQSMLGKCAFSRLYTLDSTLTTQLVVSCYNAGYGLDDVAALEARDNSEASFSLYTLLSYLVDRNDVGVSDESQVDTDYLYR